VLTTAPAQNNGSSMSFTRQLALCAFGTCHGLTQASAWALRAGLRVMVRSLGCAMTATGEVPASSRLVE